MTRTSIVLIENWMMNDCCSHLRANSKTQTANSQLRKADSRQQTADSKQPSQMLSYTLTLRATLSSTTLSRIGKIGCLLFAVCCLLSAVCFPCVLISAIFRAPRLKTIRAICYMPETAEPIAVISLEFTQ